MRRHSVEASVLSWLVMFCIVAVLALVRDHQQAVLRRASDVCAAIPLQDPESTARAAAIRGGATIEATRLGLTLRFTRHFAGDVACFVDLEKGKVVATKVQELEE
jgi:hypothetical protein